VLQQSLGLTARSHTALIGKYIYFRYLRDREILDDAWLGEHNIHSEDIFERTATAKGFDALAERLQVRFNGDIFPLPQNDTGYGVPTTPYRSWQESSPETRKKGNWLSIFKPMISRTFPVELLSSIYEYFLKDEKRSGVELSTRRKRWRTM